MLRQRNSWILQFTFIAGLTWWTPAVSTSQVITTNSASRLERIALFDPPPALYFHVTFTADGGHIVITDLDGGVSVRAVGTWEEETRFSARSGIRLRSLSPDGTMIAAGGAEGEVSVWGLDGTERFSFPFGSEMHRTRFSPDSRILAVGGSGEKLVIVDVSAKRVVAELETDYHYVSSLVFFPDGRHLLASYERPGNVMKVWDTTSWEETLTFTHVAERIDYHDAAFSPDGRFLAVASTDFAIKFLEVGSWEVVKEFEGHERGSYQVAFSPDGSLLASACDDGTVRLWDVETEGELRVFRRPQPVGSVSFSPDGTLLVFGVWGEGVEVWGVGDGGGG